MTKEQYEALKQSMITIADTVAKTSDQQVYTRVLIDTLEARNESQKSVLLQLNMRIGTLIAIMGV